MERLSGYSNIPSLHIRAIKPDILINTLTGLRAYSNQQKNGISRAHTKKWSDKLLK